MKKQLAFPKYKSVKVAKKRLKKVSKSTLRNKADSLFSKFVRFVGVCQAKGLFINCGGHLQCAHIVTRGNTALRYKFENALSLCMGHHRWFHQHPFEWVAFIQREFPNNFAYVMEHKNDKVKRTEELYREVIEKYLYIIRDDQNENWK